MNVLFEEGGKFQAGRILSEADTSLQVELDSGKRVKLKAANALLRFAAPSPAELLAQAQAQAADIDRDLAWEFAPEGDFGYAQIAQDYFSGKPDAVQQAAALMALFDAPHYFRRLGKGQFRKAPAEIVQAALAAIERKQQIAAQIEQWAAELAAGNCPEPIREQLYKILFRPDKNAPEYKAVVQAARQTQRSPLDLLQSAGAITSAYQFHWRRFLFETFPNGTGFAPATAPAIDALPRADVQAFSIDDSHTTEIDDALSVQGLGTGRVTLGIHIAAPGLAITPGSPADRIARDRLSTVYLPGGKLTMLPDAMVQAWTLEAGRECPAVSQYVVFDESTLEVLERRTALETVPIATNLRHDQLDDVITEQTLTGEQPADYPFADELAFTFRLARHLKAQREVVRGKPEVFTRPDFSFALEPGDTSGSSSGAPPVLGAGGKPLPDGSERVRITERQRGAPLDLIVSEAMILANSGWGKMLADAGVPGIYRSQASMAPGIKVRMGTRALPHAGMGVAQYTWATSPLRRYVDLVNQWQIIAVARHGATAALVAPFKPKDASLMGVIADFDGAYSAYQGFQSQIERYWTLRWLAQEGVTELDATVIKEGLVRADTLPLVFPALGAASLPRGEKVRVRINGTDLLTLDVHATVLAHHAAAAAADGADAALDDSEEDEGDDAATAGAAIALAIDVGDAGDAGDAAPTGIGAAGDGPRGGDGSAQPGSSAPSATVSGSPAVAQADNPA